MAFLWLINGGDPNYLLIGMILQVATYHIKVLPKTVGYFSEFLRLLQPVNLANFRQAF